LADVQLDEALLQQQREAYAVAGVDEAEPAHALKKRKKEHANGADDVSLSDQLATVPNRS